MKKLYIMGCGRSGTTFLLTLMTCFKDTYAHIEAAQVPGEDSYKAFENLNIDANNAVIKRSSDAYDFVSEIPDDINLIYMVRHPLDVVTSTLTYRNTTYKNYIPPERWIAEACALRAIVSERQDNRPFIVHYEDLVRNADGVQKRLQDYFELDVDIPFSKCHERFEPSNDINETLNGLRPPDPSSIDRWKKEDFIEHAKDTWRHIRQEAIWFCEEFDYSISEIDNMLSFSP